ncbi:MAG: YggS family pyridoxal phosphate-dependent enzyme [Chloroflexota bacterium]
MTIRERVPELLAELPPGVILVAVAKGRTPEEVLEAVRAGAKVIGENYVQEAERAYALVGNRVQWHFIGHLQKNKVKKAVRVFDMVETVDSLELAREIDKRCREFGKVMPVLVEVNSGREAQKTGVLPEEALRLIEEVSRLENLRVMGLMTIGPVTENPEDIRPYFARTRRLLETIQSRNLPGVEMRYLSMGMSSTYKIALEEGANIVRIGTRLFGERHNNE